MAVEHLRGFFGGDLAVDIKTPRIRQFILEMQDKEYSNASINRYLAALRRMFNLMNEEDDMVPTPHFPMLKEDNVRQRMIELPDLEHLLSLLPDYLRLPIEFAGYFGWRKGEFRSLEWRDVSLDACEMRLRPENSKNATGRVVALH